MRTMAIKFQYNKIALQSLNKKLQIRLKALPIIKNKEVALRVEVKRAKDRIKELDEKLSENIKEYKRAQDIWSEFDTNLIIIYSVETATKKIAGVKTPVLKEVIFHVNEFSLFNEPAWFSEGVSIIKELAGISIEKEIFIRKMQLLHHARRKTTQKVNLYEKVQIPGYEDAIRKVTRFLEDEENLSKSAQKIVKNRKK